MASFVEHNQSAAVQALQHLQKERPDLCPSSLRCLRALRTPEAHRDVIRGVGTENFSMAQFVAAALEAEKQMWVRWHWRAGNDRIDPSRRMSAVCDRFLCTPCLQWRTPSNGPILTP